jgi:hypothetical protein
MIQWEYYRISALNMEPVKFAAPWNPNEPIETFFDRLEDCYVFSIMAKPPYTQEQLIDNAIMSIQCTGLYKTALLEWQGFTEENKTWQPSRTRHGRSTWIHQPCCGRG